METPQSGYMNQLSAIKMQLFFPIESVADCKMSILNFAPKPWSETAHLLLHNNGRGLFNHITRLQCP